jgi:hypothetical protein
MAIVLPVTTQSTTLLFHAIAVPFIFVAAQSTCATCGRQLHRLSLLELQHGEAAMCVSVVLLAWRFVTPW